MSLVSESREGMGSGAPFYPDALVGVDGEDSEQVEGTGAAANGENKPKDKRKAAGAVLRSVDNAPDAHTYSGSFYDLPCTD